MAWRSDIAQEMIRPMLGVLKATPVASFIILALVWIDTQILAAVISFIMVLPLVYHNVREGFDAADTKLLEMARMFELSRAKTFRYCYLPAILPVFPFGGQQCAGICLEIGNCRRSTGQTGKSNRQADL